MNARAKARLKQAASLGGHYSRRVDQLRFTLPAIAMSLLAVVMVWPWLAGGYNGLIVPVFKSAADHAHDAMRMSKPRYMGKTGEAEAYEVTASSAVLDPANPDRIHLDELHAVFEPARSSAVLLRADEGIYLRKQNRLELDGGLELTFGEGYRFATESAEVDLKRGRVFGAQPVTGEGPVGSLAADKFDIEDGGNRFRFGGGVKVTIWPEEPAT